MPDRLKRFWRQPLSRKLQYASLLAARIKTRTLYRLRLRSCGRRSCVLRPLFWTPEFVSIGADVLVWPGCRIEALEVDGQPAPHIAFEDGVTMQQNCHITAAATLRIGAGTTILFDVMITDIDHEYDRVGTRVVDQSIKVRTTQIGRNCFIGSGAKILAGTLLGDSCVVGANAVVRGDFPSGAVIAGNPARIVKRYDSAARAWLKLEPQP
jgi:acetyltransferase-like isoleucine patch superfamily enzyme